MYAHTNICTHYIFACTHMFTYTPITTLFSTYHAFVWASQVAQLVKNLPANQETPSFDSWVGKFPWRRDRLPTPGFLGFPGGSAGKGKWKWSCSVMSDSLWPQGLQPTRLLHPWDFPGKSTGVGCHFLLQGIFLTQGLNPGLPHCKQMNPGKETTTMWETWVQSLSLEDPLEKGTAIHSSILAWRIPWTEEPGKLQSMGCKEPDTIEELSCSYICFCFLNYKLKDYYLSKSQSLADSKC